MKRIAIIGGGISGLAVLHFLKKRCGDSVDITLYERDRQSGGTIRSFNNDSCLFEWGPNGFLDNQAITFELIQDIGHLDQLIAARAVASRRYIQINGKLLKVPSNPLDFFQTPLLPFKDKYSLIAGILKRKVSKDCSIHDYVSQRFSPNIAETLADPIISGIYAGNIKQLHMASVFRKTKGSGFKKSHMRSFKKGMGQIIEALEIRYKKYIQTNVEIQNISALPSNPDITIIATPAYVAANIIENTNPVLARFLTQMPYAPLAVAGLHFNQDSFKKIPDGFGYLIPSCEKKDVLGVLIESNVYDYRSKVNQTMVRVMLGGAHHPAIINDSQKEILSKAIVEIDMTYGLRSNPVETFVKQWPKAIPQYGINYPQWRQSVAEQCQRTPGLYLCANYLDGVSFNDCIKNAKSMANSVKI